MSKPEQPKKIVIPHAEAAAIAIRNLNLVPGTSSDWMTHGLCKDKADIFHDDTREEAAKAICQLCDVQAACLSDALQDKNSFGVRGGLSEGERGGSIRRARRLRKIALQKDAAKQETA